MSNHNPHILFVIDHFYPYIGGGEILFWELTRGLVKNGYRVTVITSRHDKQLASHETTDGVEVIRVGSNRLNYQWYGMRAGLQYCKKHKVDIVHGTSFF